MVNGITTVISSSVITEKIADVQGRTAENNQLANTVAVQEQAHKNLSTVQQVEKSDTVKRIDKKKEKEEKKKEKKRPTGNTGKNLDLQA